MAARRQPLERAVARRDAPELHAPLDRRPECQPPAVAGRNRAVGLAGHDVAVDRRGQHHVVSAGQVPARAWRRSVGAVRGDQPQIGTEEVAGQIAANRGDGRAIGHPDRREHDRGIGGETRAARSICRDAYEV